MDPATLVKFGIAERRNLSNLSQNVHLQLGMGNTSREGGGDNLPKGMRCLVMESVMESQSVATSIT